MPRQSHEYCTNNALRYNPIQYFFLTSTFTFHNKVKQKKDWIFDYAKILSNIEAEYPVVLLNQHI
jgi:hypothetical protein